MKTAQVLEAIPREVAVGNIFCIGRNYAAHAAELGNKVPDEPVVFLKPTSAINTGHVIQLPPHSSDVHYECELVLLIGQGGKNILESRAWGHVQAVGLGLDLTARDLQSKAKAGGLPWAVAKGFDDSAVLSPMVSTADVGDWRDLNFTLQINGMLRQQGDVSQMLFSITSLISYLSRMFTLQEGDVIFTGTPEGVGPLDSGDELNMVLTGLLSHSVQVA